MKDFFQTTVYIQSISNAGLRAINDMKIGRLAWMNNKILEDAENQIDGLIYTATSILTDAPEKVLISRIAREVTHAMQEHYKYCNRETECMYRK